MPFDDGRDRDVERRGVGSEQQVDLVHGDQPLIDLGRLRRYRLVVIRHELDLSLLLAADAQAARRVDLIAPELIGLNGDRAGDAKVARLGHGEADLQRILGPARPTPIANAANAPSTNTAQRLVLDNFPCERIFNLRCMNYLRFHSLHPAALRHRANQERPATFMSNRLSPSTRMSRTRTEDA